MPTPATSAAVTTSPTFSRPTVSISSSGHTTTRYMPYGTSSAVSTLTRSAPHIASPSIVPTPPPHSWAHSPWPSGPSIPHRPLLQVEPFKLDKFSGNIEEWPGFWKQFDVAVDSQDYSDIEKINLLYQCLVGKAKLRVAGIPRSEENYALVKNLLREAYDRPDRLLRNLMKKLEELRIPHNTPSDLEAFHIELESICHQLEAMGHDVNNLSTRLAIQKRLPRDLLQRWMETSAVDERMWTTDFLRDKLRHQVDIYESLGDYHHEPHYTDQACDDAQPRFTTTDGVTYVIRNSSSRMEKSDRPPKRHSAVRKKFKCPFCGREHRAAKCDIYSSLQQRIRRAAAKGLCTRCLRGKHSATQCKSKLGPCRTCSGKHHVSLCDRLLGQPSTFPSGQASVQQRKDQQSATHASLAVGAENVRDYDSDDSYWKDNVLESEDSSADELGSVEQELEQAAVIAHNEPSTVTVMKAQKTHGCLLAVASGSVSNPSASSSSKSVYILLDSCSSTTYISTEAAKKLKLNQAATRRYNFSTFGSTKPLSMPASNTTFELHLLDGRRLNISAKVVPHIVGLTAMCETSDSDLDDLRRMAQKYLPTKTVQPDILIGTKHLYKVGFTPEGRHLRSGFTVVKTGLGPVVTGHGKMVTNLKPVESCNLVVHDDKEVAEYHHGSEPKNIQFGEPYVQHSSGEALDSFSQVETVMGLGQTTSAAAGRGPSPHEDHVKERQCHVAGPERTEAPTDISGSGTDLSVDQNTGFPSLPPETPLDVHGAFSSFSVGNTSSKSVYQSTWVYEEQSNVLGALPGRGAVITITKDGASASNFPWSKNCHIAQRFLHDHPRGPFTTNFQFHRQLCVRSYQSWDRLSFTHAIDEVWCKVNPRHAQMTYLPTVRTNAGDCEVFCICDCRGQALVAALAQRQGDCLYVDATYLFHEADVRDLAAYLSNFYPYLRVRIICSMFVQERLEQWPDVTLPAKDILRNEMASVDEPTVRNQTHPTFIGLSVDDDLLKLHRRTCLKPPEYVIPSGHATSFGPEMRLNEIWRCYEFDLGDNPGLAPVPQAPNIPPSQHPRDIPGSRQVFVQCRQPSRQVQNDPGPSLMHAARPTPLLRQPHTSAQPLDNISDYIYASGSGFQRTPSVEHGSASTTAAAVNVSIDLVRQAVREVMEERSGHVPAMPNAGGARGHRRDDDGRRDDRGRIRERGQERSSAGRGRSSSSRRRY